MVLEILVLIKDPQPALINPSPTPFIPLSAKILSKEQKQEFLNMLVGTLRAT